MSRRRRKKKKKGVTKFSKKDVAKYNERMDGQSKYVKVENPDPRWMFPLFASWMEKRGKLVKNWKKRWFILEIGGTLFYFKHPKTTQTKGRVTVKRKRFYLDDKKPNCIRIERDGGDFYFCAENSVLRDKWLDILAECGGIKVEKPQLSESSEFVSSNLARDMLSLADKEGKYDEKEVARDLEQIRPTSDFKNFEVLQKEYGMTSQQYQQLQQQYTTQQLQQMQSQYSPQQIQMMMKQQFQPQQQPVPIPPSPQQQQPTMNNNNNIMMQPPPQQQPMMVQQPQQQPPSPQFVQPQQQQPQMMISPQQQLQQLQYQQQQMVHQFGTLQSQLNDPQTSEEKKKTIMTQIQHLQQQQQILMNNMIFIQQQFQQQQQQQQQPMINYSQAHVARPQQPQQQQQQQVPNQGQDLFSVLENVVDQARANQKKGQMGGKKPNVRIGKNVNINIRTKKQQGDPVECKTQ